MWRLDPFLKARGKSVGDISIAMGIGDAGEPMVHLVRVNGVPASAFAPALFQTKVYGMDRKTVGGKDVLYTGAAGSTTVAYLHDDVLACILMASDAEATQILSAMPRRRTTTAGALPSERPSPIRRNLLPVTRTLLAPDALPAAPALPSASPAPSELGVA